MESPKLTIQTASQKYLQKSGNGSIVVNIAATNATSPVRVRKNKSNNKMSVPELPARGRLPLTDIPPELRLKIGQNIEAYSIILLLDGAVCGTGTLVTVDGIHGILTAAHVAEVLEGSKSAAKRRSSLGTVLDHRGSKLIDEPVKHFDCFATSPEEGQWGPFGPDLALVRLPSPSNLLSSLQAKKSFWDLTRHGVAARPVVFTEKTPIASYGVVDEKTERKNNQVVINALVFFGTSPQVFDRQEYDY
jgi:hypothetical protein